MSLFKKAISNPLGLFKKGMEKYIMGPLIYGIQGDYDAEKYWSDRFNKYGLSLQGAGDEGLSEQENECVYEGAERIFLDLCHDEGIDFANCRVLEIGCGTGFYTGIMRKMGVTSYVGIDITDALFPKLKALYPGFDFIRKDITSDRIVGEFDLVIMIDVIEHIVKEERFDSAMSNVKEAMADGAVFLQAPVMEKSCKRLFYLRFWSFEDIKKRFEGYLFGDLIPFRDGKIVSIRKKAR